MKQSTNKTGPYCNKESCYVVKKCLVFLLYWWMEHFNETGSIWSTYRKDPQ